MTVRMIVTHQQTTRRNRRRSRFLNWWHNFATDIYKIEHLINCDGCFGPCRAYNAEIRKHT